jgi:cyclic-di-GMP-binding protein
MAAGHVAYQEPGAGPGAARRGEQEYAVTLHGPGREQETRRRDGCARFWTDGRAPSRLRAMATQNSFDVSTGADLQEVDNAVNQAMKEIGQRYDFKGTKCAVSLDRTKSELRLEADDEYRLKAVVDVLQSKLVRRGVSLKNVELGKVEPASGGTVRQLGTLTQGIPAETARRIVKVIKDAKLRKVQAAIQGDQVRVSSTSRDDLQEVIRLLKEEDFGIELNFGNYR